jgi:hypothetical protein
MENAAAPASALPDLIKTARDAAHILQTQVIQGVSEAGAENPDHKYKLRMDGIELGDNESIRVASREFVANKENKRKLRQKLKSEK